MSQRRRFVLTETPNALQLFSTLTKATPFLVGGGVDVVLENFKIEGESFDKSF